MLVKKLSVFQPEVPQENVDGKQAAILAGRTTLKLRVRENATCSVWVESCCSRA